MLASPAQYSLAIRAARRGLKIEPTPSDVRSPPPHLLVKGMNRLLGVHRSRRGTRRGWS